MEPVKDDLPGKSDDGFDPAERQLCPDETCIGVIGLDGRCKVCGKEAADTSARADPPPASGTQDNAEVGDPFDAPDAPEADLSVAEDPEFTRRQLCPDGACIGVIGQDGRCKLCGLTAAPAPPDEPDEAAAVEFPTQA